MLYIVCLLINLPKFGKGRMFFIKYSDCSTGAEMKALILLYLLSIGIISNIQCKPSSEAVMVKTYNQTPREIQVQDQNQVSENNEENNSEESGESSEGNEEEQQLHQKDSLNIPEETENAEVKQLSQKDKKTKKEIEKFGAAFTKVLTHTLLLTVGPQTGHVFGIVTTILLYSSGMMGGQKSDLWSQLKERIKVEVGKGLAEYHFHQTRKFRLEIENKIAKKDGLTVEHWDEIIARNKFDFFPQTNPATGYDERLCLLPVAWVTYMVAALGQLENLEKVPRCSVSNELKKVKEDLRQAAKEMFRKRYKAMSGINYWSKGSSCSGRFSCSDTRTWRYQMVDGTTDEKFVVTKRSRGSPSWSEYNKYKTDTVDVVWNKMVNKINDFFTADICREGCECPTPLRKDEITWSYVSGCFGKLDETDYCNQCDTPCKNYGESYTWCGCTEHDLRKTWTWDYCRAANWDVCRGETPYPFQRAKEFEDSREKNKRMKKQKTE